MQLQKPPTTRWNAHLALAAALLKKQCAMEMEIIDESSRAERQGRGTAEQKPAAAEVAAALRNKNNWVRLETLVSILKRLGTVLDNLQTNGRGVCSLRRRMYHL